MPWPLYPQERDPVPTVHEAGRAQGPVWMGAKDLDSTAGFDRQTAQPVVSLYTNHAIPAHVNFIMYTI
jgi:hypothetical protein